MTFQGFKQPEQNYSKLPHEFIDLLPEIDSLAELKVVLYVLRHTWGFSEYDKPKKMTLDELQNGRKRRDGSRMDGGTGLSVNSIKSGAEKAVERGILTVEVDETDAARIEKWYCLNMSDESKFDTRLSNLDTRLSKVDSLPSKVDNRTEKETIERKQTTPKGDLVDLELSKLPAISLRQAISEYFKLNVNWETKTARQWMEWAVQEGVTSAQIASAANTWRMDKQFNWQVPTLKGIFEKWQMLMDASAMNETIPQREEGRSSGYYA